MRVLRALAIAVVIALLISGCGPGSYDSCESAREAGAAPLHEGDDGWNSKLDRDGDGVACES